MCRRVVTPTTGPCTGTGTGKLALALALALAMALALALTLALTARVAMNGTPLLQRYTLAMAFQKTFEPPVPSVEGGGYDMGLALLPL